MNYRKQLFDFSDQEIAKDKNTTVSYKGIKMRLLEKYKPIKGLSPAETMKNRQSQKRVHK